jgi:hypothetical protein
MRAYRIKIGKRQVLRGWKRKKSKEIKLLGYGFSN